MSASKADLIDIALSFDDGFWAPACATIRSVCATANAPENLVFHLCRTPLSATHLRDIEAVAKEFGATLKHYDVTQSDAYLHYAASLPHTRHISAIMYARLFFDQLLAPCIDRLIYIDTDVLVRQPIEELYDFDLGGKPLGAGSEPSSYLFFNGRDARGDIDLFDPAGSWFNSGVLLIDLKQWREMDLAGQLEELHTKNILDRLKNDQHILNLIFEDRWADFGWRWNTLAVSRDVEALNGAIIHYGGPHKPWNLFAWLPYRRAYIKTMTPELFWQFLAERIKKRWRKRLKRQGQGA